MLGRMVDTLVVDYRPVQGCLAQGQDCLVSASTSLDCSDLPVLAYLRREWLVAVSKDWLGALILVASTVDSGYPVVDHAV